MLIFVKIYNDTAESMKIPSFKNQQYPKDMNQTTIIQVNSHIQDLIQQNINEKTSKNYYTRTPIKKQKKI